MSLRFAPAVVSVFFWALALGIALLSAVLNWHYGHKIWTSGSTETAYVIAAIFVVVDLVKFGSSGLLAQAFGFRRYKKAFGLGVVVMVFSCLSIAATVQVVFEDRAIFAGKDDRDKTRLGDLKSELTNVKLQIKALGTPLPAAVVLENLKQFQTHRRFATTSGCNTADITAPASRTFCNRYFAMRERLAAANKADQLREREAELRTLVRTSTTADTMTQRQVGMQVVADATGMDKKVVGAIVMAVVSIAMELAGFVAWAIAAGSYPAPVNSKLSEGSAKTTSDASPKRSRRASKPTAKNVSKRVADRSADPSPIDLLTAPQNGSPSGPISPLQNGSPSTGDVIVLHPSVSGDKSTPTASLGEPIGEAFGETFGEASVSTALQVRSPAPEQGENDATESLTERFAAERLEKVRGAMISAQDLQEDLAKWCARDGLEKPSDNRFGRDLRRLGFRKSRCGRGSRTFYHDITLRGP